MYLLGFGAANIGFLIRNWHPAKIFMGDTGSISAAVFLLFLYFIVGLNQLLAFTLGSYFYQYLYLMQRTHYL